MSEIFSSGFGKMSRSTPKQPKAALASEVSRLSPKELASRQSAEVAEFNMLVANEQQRERDRHSYVVIVRQCDGCRAFNYLYLISAGISVHVKSELELCGLSGSLADYSNKPSHALSLLPQLDMLASENPEFVGAITWPIQDKRYPATTTWPDPASTANFDLTGIVDRRASSGSVTVMCSVCINLCIDQNTTYTCVPLRRALAAYVLFMLPSTDVVRAART